MYIERLLQSPLEVIIFLAAIILAVTVHEFAHAWSADELGDPTARLLGRKSLDPRKHLDFWGSIMFLLAGFGWGKPVPVDSFNLRDEAKDNAIIALAGPVSNLIIAAVAGTIFRFLPSDSGLFGAILYLVGSVNVSLAVFNLLPIPPLDGSKIYRAVFPQSFLPVWQFLDQYGVYILLFLVISGSGIISNVIGPIITLVMNLLGF
ncbi:MAG: site-2 protease family protein [bacterium]|nr:site-2 protease family protein [bacterium]